MFFFYSAYITEVVLSALRNHHTTAINTEGYDDAAFLSEPAFFLFKEQAYSEVVSVSDVVSMSDAVSVSDVVSMSDVSVRDVSARDVVSVRDVVSGSDVVSESDEVSGSDVVTVNGVMGVALVNDAASTSFCAFSACYWCLQLVGMVALISLSLSSHALDVLCAGINPWNAYDLDYRKGRVRSLQVLV